MKRVFFSSIIVAISLLMIAIRLFFAFTYPIKYQTEIHDCATNLGIDKALIYSIINTESRFNQNAKSSAGAIGLMQLMPKTAEYCAEMQGIEFSEEMLYEPKHNIRLGSYYLLYLMQKFPVRENFLAAYNAGEGNVQKWLTEQGKAPNQPLETIPFKETRDYIKRVNINYNYYKKQA